MTLDSSPVLGISFNSPMVSSRIPIGYWLIALLFPTVALAQVEWVRVWPGYRTAESFTTLAEYFGGKPSSANRTALRSQPDDRAGYYWLARIKTDRDHPDSVVRLEVTRRGSMDPAVYAFDWQVPSGNHPILVGLTGRDWTDPAEVPLAWRITLIDADGTLLTSTHSFLWDANPL